MPNYTYTVEDGEEGCHTCAEGFRVKHTLGQVLRTCQSCGSRVRKKIRARDIQVLIKEKHRANYSDYREDLARFPGDPEAFVTTPQQVDRLTEKRQRQGWILRDEDWGDMFNTMPSGSLEDGPEIEGDGRALVQEAYEEALEDLDGI